MLTLKEHVALSFTGDQSHQVQVPRQHWHSSRSRCFLVSHPLPLQIQRLSLQQQEDVCVVVGRPVLRMTASVASAGSIALRKADAHPRLTDPPEQRQL